MNASMTKRRYPKPDPDSPKATNAQSASAGEWVRALSLYEPWASFMAVGVKTIETRSIHFPRSYRGPLLICASQRRRVHEFQDHLLDPDFGRALAHVTPVGREPSIDDLAFGQAVALVDLIDYQDTTVLLRRRRMLNAFGEDEKPFGDYAPPDRTGLITGNLRRIEPFFVSGWQGFFWARLPPDLRDWAPRPGR